MTKLWHPGVLQEEKAIMKESDWEVLHEWETLHKKEKKEKKKGGDNDDKSASYFYWRLKV